MSCGAPPPPPPCASSARPALPSSPRVRTRTRRAGAAPRGMKRPQRLLASVDVRVDRRRVAGGEAFVRRLVDLAPVLRRVAHRVGTGGAGGAGVAGGAGPPGGGDGRRAPKAPVRAPPEPRREKAEARGAGGADARQEDDLALAGAA